MTNLEQLALRRALSAVRRADLPDVVLTVVGKVGGQAALMAAIAEAQNARVVRTRKRAAARRAVA